jgi:four helix bundle protein
MKSSYRNLLAWQKGMDLVDEIYLTVKTFPRSEMFVLNIQMRKAAMSVPCNIAEGQGRYSLRDFRHYLRQARASALELETECLIAMRQRYVSQERADALIAQIMEVIRLVNGLIRYINRQLRLRTANREPRTTDDPNPSAP